MMESRASKNSLDAMKMLGSKLLVDQNIHDANRIVYSQESMLGIRQGGRQVISQSEMLRQTRGDSGVSLNGGGGGNFFTTGSGST